VSFLPGVVVDLTFPQPQPRRRTVDDIIHDLAVANKRDRETRGRLRAAQVYTPEEMRLLGRLKGGGSRRERAITQIKQMMQEDVQLALAGFINQQKTALLERQIQAIIRQVTDTYDEALKRLGYTEKVDLQVTLT
jgi:hypothetical protein